MKATVTKHFTLLAGLSLTLLVSLPGLLSANDRSDRHPTVTAVTGQSDWLIVPPAIPSEYVTFYEDGSAAIKRMPLAGNFSLAGDDTAIEGIIKGTLNADLDPTLSGPIYGPLVVTKKIKGREIVLLEGRFFGRVNGLLASGQILLHGRGQFAGVTIAVSFLETGANTEIFTLTGHLFDPCGD
jgi:hypothetical protein